MNPNFSYTELYVSCPGCGNPIRVPDESGVKIICESCDFEAIHSKQIKYSCYLKFQIGNNKECVYRVPGNIIIGRNNKHILTIRDPITKTEEEIPIRISEVSKKHAQLSVSDKYEIKEIDGKRYLINYPQCIIEDSASLNGTGVNGNLIGDKYVLKHGDKIILAPNCKQFVEIEYLIKRS
ncbi:MAG: FHA domain-containing protein [Promethearchaeota archaeon]